ncbi:MAG TPA: type 1 glutamine amidotransferase [Devosia sp.]|nr:type 1 glutamine amidotransferase [Devosia sp.]
MKLTILLTGENSKALRVNFGPYASKFERMFKKAAPGFTFETVKVLESEPIPDVSQLEGVVVTGSAKGVYDDTEWMEPLRAAIRRIYAARVPMLGICFGHQIMADALGGKVVKSEKGWGIGRHVYKLGECPAYFNHPSGELAIAASHQDQVIDPPKEARTFISSDFTPNAGLIYDNGAAMSMQPHPEFELEYSAGIVELRRNNPLNDNEVQAALDSLSAPMDNDFVGKALGRFFLEAARG